MPNLPQTSSTCAPIVLHMHKKFEVNQTKIKGGCQSYTKAAPKESWNDLTLIANWSLNQLYIIQFDFQIRRLMSMKDLVIVIVMMKNLIADL